MLTLRQSGMEKVRAGLTSIEEVARVASLSRMSATPLLGVKRRARNGRLVRDMEAAAAPTRTVRLRRGPHPDGRGARLGRPSQPGLSPGDPRAGRITPLEEYAPLTAQQTRDTVYSLLNDDQRKRFESHKQLDLAYAVPGVARFRVNCFFQRGSISAAFRRIPHQIPKLDELGLPRIFEELTRKPRGLVLVTGPTGSGKSTTLAAMLDIINEERDEHILTIEDPIEFLHNHKRCMVNQREIGADAEDFATALKRGAP